MLDRRCINPRSSLVSWRLAPYGRVAMGTMEWERNVRTHARMRSTVLTVRRRCLVCDEEEVCEEPAEAEPIGRACSSCHAPTERVAVVRRRTKPLARNPHAAALGRLGGLKGGPARAQLLSAERRREIARHAARKRWGLTDD